MCPIRPCHSGEDCSAKRSSANTKYRQIDTPLNRFRAADGNQPRDESNHSITGQIVATTLHRQGSPPTRGSRSTPSVGGQVANKIDNFNKKGQGRDPRQRDSRSLKTATGARNKPPSRHVFSPRHPAAALTGCFGPRATSMAGPKTARLLTAISPDFSQPVIPPSTVKTCPVT